MQMFAYFISNTSGKLLALRIYKHGQSSVFLKYNQLVNQLQHLRWINLHKMSTRISFLTRTPCRDRERIRKALGVSVRGVGAYLRQTRRVGPSPHITTGVRPCATQGLQFKCILSGPYRPPITHMWGSATYNVQWGASFHLIAQSGAATRTRSL